MAAKASRLVTADVEAEEPKLETEDEELRIKHDAKIEDTARIEEVDRIKHAAKIEDTARIEEVDRIKHAAKIEDTARIEEIDSISEETMEDFSVRRHRTIKIPQEKRDYYLGVKFKNLKRSSHALDVLMEEVQAPMEDEDVKTVKTLHRKWVKNYDAFLETDEQYRLMITLEEETNYQKWYRERDLKYSTFKAELEEWLVEKEARSEDNLSSVSRSNSLRSLVSSRKLESDTKLAELAVRQRTLMQKMKIEQERLNLTMMEEQLKIQTEIDIEEAKSKVLDCASSVGSIMGSRPRSEALGLTEDYIETVKTEKIQLRSAPSLPQMPKTPRAQSQEGFVSIVKMMNKPKVKIQPFGGNPLQYHRFLRQFHSKVSNNCDDTEEKLELLGQYTEGDAHAVIKGYLSMANAEAAYQTALEELHERYGDPEIMVTAYVQKVMEWPIIRADSPRELDKFAIFLAECEHAVASVDAVKILEYSENIKKIISKLPFGLHDKWRNLVYQLKENKKSVHFTQLVQFVRREARKANDPLYGRDALKDNTKGKEQRQPNKFSTRSRSKGTFATRTEVTEVKKEPSADGGNSTRIRSRSSQQSLVSAFTAPCANCNGVHPMELCKKLNSLPYDDRIQILKQKAFCYGCLRIGHQVRDCKNRATCTHCKRRHPSVLHVDGGPQKLRDSVTAPRVVVSTNVGMQGGKEPDVTMAVVPVRIGRRDGAFSCVTYAFMDPGSNISFMSESLQHKIGCQGARKRLSMETMGVEHVMDTSAIRGIHITGLDEKHVVSLPTLYTKDKIPVSKEHIPTTEDIHKWQHLEGIVLPEVDAEIGLLLGNNAPDVYSPIEVITGPPGTPHVTRTRIGWIAWNVIRSENSANSSVCNTHVVNRVTATVSEFEEGRRLEKLYQKSVALDFSERLTQERPENSREDQCFLETLNTSKRFTDGHYVFRLPLKKQAVLPDNRSMALGRLSSLQKRMLRDTQYREDYKNFMAVLLEKKYAERVPDEEENRQNGRTWYLPHHGVYHPQKKKLRVVFDCSARYQGVSLNDVLYQGPDLANSLISVLAKFRQERVAISGDIEKMFYQVQVAEDDRDCMRFYWWEDGNVKTDPKIYRMTVHIFGAASSPSVANFALQQVFQDNKFGSAFSDSPVKNFYVDDYLCSVSTIDEAVTNIQDVCSLCQKGGFRLTKWQSNQQAVLDRVPVTERASSDSLYERTLGIVWNVDSDCFHFQIRPPVNTKVTRRTILSDVSSIYDPLGLISPFLLPAKIILQDLCRRKFDWDAILSGQLLTQWDHWRENIARFDFIIPRCHKPSQFGCLRNAQLHMFSDASEKGYGVAAYIRLEDDTGKVHCSLVMGKSRVAPIKQQTIPRLELAAATTAVRLNHQIQKMLEPGYIINEVLYWTDSMAVIRYITNQSSRYQTFVANRLAVIHDGSDISEWRYVNTTSNPADHASRGIVPEQMKTEWFTGPEFLWRDRSQWPQIEQFSGSLSLEPGDPELKRCVNSIKMTETSVVNHAVEFSSRWMKVKRIVSAILLAQQKFLGNYSTSVVDRLQKAESLIIRHEQQLYFAEELKDLSAGSTVKKSSPLHRFDCFLKDGIIRIGGRLQHATVPYDSKHPVVLPKSSRVSRLILEDIHRRVGHLGKNTITACSRQNFWILGSAALIRSITTKCVTCRRYQSRSCEQQMADLPTDRLCPDEPPFTRVGIDFFGPIEIKRGRSVVKRYGVIFTCLAIRAVHLEVAFSMDTDSCINAIRRFVARRGPVRIMVSDNGTNLVAAETELKREIQSLDQERLAAAFQYKSIEWHFNPPSGSHFGGVWERLIRSVRKVMYSVLKEQVIRLDDEGLQTLFCEVEAILNGRPITTISEDHREPEALTPNHLLIFQPGQEVPVGTFDKNDCYSRRRWRQIQFLSDQFWKRWLREYLPSLQKRQKWCKPIKNVQINDVVLVVESSPRNRWPLAIVTEVFKDQKGLVRYVTVRTRGSTYLKRPVDKLVLLMEGDDTVS